MAKAPLFPLALLAICLALGVSLARAEPTTAPAGEAAGVYGEAGPANVDNRTGAFTWSYPFEVPHARGKLQSQLALTYSSRRGDGDAGYGWGLGIPAIERNPSSGNPCFLADGTPADCRDMNVAGPVESVERYAYDGQPLILICRLGAGGAGGDCGDEPQPAWAQDGWRYFRLNVEGQFLRFYLSPDRRFWRVQMKGGMLAEYGEPPDIAGRGIERAFGNDRAYLRWRLVRQVDTSAMSGRADNVVEYRWQDLGKRGLLFLTDVYDTPRAARTGNLADFAHHVQLDWAPPDFPQTFYADPWRAKPDLRLTRVSVASADWDNAGPRGIVRTYRLVYQSRQETQTFVPLNQVFYPWNHAFLSEIRLEGNCGWREDERGAVPRGSECSQLPATRFEYENGYPVFGIARTTRVNGGPAGIVANDQVLPWLQSTGLVDFDGDGLPDIVQGWDGEECTDEGDDEVADHASLKVGPNQDVLECVYNRRDVSGILPRSFQSARPILGYLNRGGGLYLDLDYQCMDAGRSTDPLGLTAHASGRPPGFFSTKGSVTAVGLWSYGSLLWSYANFAPFRAERLSPPAGIAAGGSGCDARTFKEEDFHPAWRWQKTQTSIDWAKPNDDPPFNPITGGHGPYAHTPLWLVDIDGDGLIDRLGDAGIRAFDFNVAHVEWTRRYAHGETSPLAGPGPAQVPFQWDFAAAESLAPSVQAREATRFFYADVNGDGFVDLVTSNPGDDGGVPRVRPGDGRGHFYCVQAQQPWPCQEWPQEPSAAYLLAATGAKMPWPFTDETLFHDLTGDGLADIVQYDMASGEVRLWVNQDGQRFACIPASCVVGKVLDFRTALNDIGPHRITFADMDGNGIDDLVILARHGAYVGNSMMKYAAASGFERGAAPRPGLLTRIHNGYGATTDIRYESTAQMDQRLRDSKWAWRFHSPISVPVVTQVTTQDSYSAGGDPSAVQTYKFKRKSQMAYFDPAYDRWTRAFLGFRKVAARAGEDKAATVSTYWFGPCQNNDFAARLPSAPSVPLCPDGSDDDDDAATSGSLVRVDRTTEFLPVFVGQGYARPPATNPEAPRVLWTRVLHPTSQTLFARPMGRVQFGYVERTDTYLYDETAPMQADGSHAGAPGGDEILHPFRQPGVRRHLRQSVVYDARGSLKSTKAEGAVLDEDSAPGDVADPVVITLYSPENPLDPDGPSGPDDAPAVLPCNAGWICQPRFVSLWQPGDDGPATLLKKTRLGYAANGNLLTAEGWLDAASPALQRSNNGGAVAPVPANAVKTRGWHVLSRFRYDDWNNVVGAESGPGADGTPLRCTAIRYDKEFRQLPAAFLAYKAGCSGEAVENEMTFDRGLGVIARMRGPNGGESAVEYDRFGRPARTTVPSADPAAATSEEASVTLYQDRNPLSVVELRSNVSAGRTYRTVVVANALGEPFATFRQADAPNTWIVTGWTTRDEAGRGTEARRPWVFTGDPMQVANLAVVLSPPSTAGTITHLYDDFGRRAATREAAGPIAAKDRLRLIYRPLAVEARDAEQSLAGGVHSAAFGSVRYDGRGQLVRQSAHAGSPGSPDIVSTIAYDPLGQPTIWRRTGGAADFTRTMEYDTLGRPVINREPNSGSNWRYAWDAAGQLVGTSDARGCGENLLYDGIGRLTGEDYSPCEPHHPAYSPPDAAGTTGLEAAYRYDAYDDGEAAADATYRDAGRYAMDQLTGVRDRGAWTRFHYDNLSRTRQVARSIASSAEGSPSAAGPWFSQRFDFDLAGRLVRRTSGTDVADFLVGGRSEESYAYGDGGALASIASSYGALVRSVAYDERGSATSIVYGDLRGTRETSSFDPLHRLTAWTVRTPAIPPFSFPVDHFALKLAYDEVGNPTQILDQPSLPTAAGPPVPRTRKRTFSYDHLYRLLRQESQYDTADGTAPWQAPFAAEALAGSTRPMPDRVLPKRPEWQSFDYDGLGNLISTGDDAGARFDRSIGSATFGAAGEGPNRLLAADGITLRYDATGNTVGLRVVRPGSCPSGGASKCGQWLVYDWDEVGQLVRARRWDFAADATPAEPPSTAPAWDVRYAYSQGVRVRKSVTGTGRPLDTLFVFPTLRIEDAGTAPGTGASVFGRNNVHLMLGGLAHAFWDHDGTLPHQPQAPGVTMDLAVADLLGGTSLVLNQATSGLVERITYQPFGATESDHRTGPAGSRRATYRFSGKEDDVEVGLTYFGARYYLPELGRFLSPDPLTVHAAASDWNPYAYVGGRVTTTRDIIGLDAEDDRKAEEIRRAGCIGKECESLPKPKEPPPPSDTVPPDPGPGQPTPGPEQPPRQPVAVEPYDPGRDMNFVDRWIWGGTGAFHDAVTSDANLTKVQYAATAVTVVALVGLDILTTGGQTSGALFARATPTMLAALATYASTNPEAVSEFEEEGAAVAVTVRNGIGVIGSAGSQTTTSLQRIMDFGAGVAPRFGALQNAMRADPGMVSGAPGISPRFVNLAAQYPGLAPAIYGKAFERFSIGITPNLVRSLGGAYQPDAILRIGNTRVFVDWTTWSQMGQHMDRIYYQERPFLFFLHVGFM